MSSELAAPFVCTSLAHKTKRKQAEVQRPACNVNFVVDSPDADSENV